ncbi:MAG TPA: copper amine oxidase N-terminal domain-containing protein [Epulopiscium sp.]|nr:copper amine oxidase N-terminal domain-containing protein [Candidatus Epulonipiscium sp.]
MKFRQKFAAVLAALMLATSLPTFAASTNGVNKIITVAKGTPLDATMAPQLKIELKDELTSGQAFYLTLENAEWDKDIATELATDENFGYKLSSNNKQLEVKAKGDLKDKTKTYMIPMLTKVTGGDATVIIDSNDTVITSGKYVFATSNNQSAIVTAADAKAFATVGTMSEITIEEAHIGAFKNDDEKKTQKVRFELEGSGFEFDYDKGEVLAAKLLGTKAYTDAKFSVTVIDATTIEATIKANDLKATQRGALTLTGIKVRATKDAAYGDVNVIVSGDLNDSTEVLVAKYGDYSTELKVAKEYTAVAGQKLKDIEFTLSETVADSLNGNRETIFSFPEGVTIDTVSVIKAEGLQDKADAPVASIVKDDDTNTNQFKVKSIASDSKSKTAITFKATLNVPASFAKDLDLSAEGRSIEGKKEVKVATVTAPATVEITSATVKVGIAKQIGGKVVIKETEKGSLSAGKMFLAIDDSDFNYTAAPEVKVTEGNLKIDSKAKIVKGGIEVTVTGKSTAPSTLEINGGELKVNGYVPEGTYTVKVGGPALSVHSAATLWDAKKVQHEDIDAIVEQDFIFVGSKEEANKPNKSTFVIGKSNYTVNGEEKTMDTPAYISGGRTMLPVRYVADALGVDPSQILWDGPTKTVTILAERVVQIKLGSKSMLINGANVPMSSAAEMKNSRVFVPVAEIARALGANVAWDDMTKTASFN